MKSLILALAELTSLAHPTGLMIMITIMSVDLR